MPLLAVFFAGCSVTPTKIAPEQYREQVDLDLAAMFVDQEPFDGSLSLYEAIARAIKYNLDHRLKLMEEALNRGQLEVARYEMLPELVADAGYHWRNNESGASSESLITGTESLEPSTSEERIRNTASLTTVWNVLDFGVSYVHAQQQADYVLIVNERRRKVIHNIVQDVRFAYWRAVSAERLLPKMDELLRTAYAALNRAKQMEKLQLQPPMQSLKYQQGLLEVIRRMWQMRESLATAKTELSALIDLKPGTEFELEDAASDRLPPPVSLSLAELEEIALHNRPELIEEHYQARIGALEVKKAMLRMLPGLELSLGGYADTNDFLYNSSWINAGAAVSWNIFKLLSGPAEIELAKAKQSVDELRRLSLGMAVLTQVHLAHQRFRIARKNFEVTRDLMDVETRLQKLHEARQDAKAGSELETIRSRAGVLAVEMQRDLGYAELQNAFGQIYTSLGIDPLDRQVVEADVATLALAIEARLGNDDLAALAGQGVD